MVVFAYLGRCLRRLVQAAASRMPLGTPSGCMAGSLLLLFGVGWLLPALLSAAARMPVAGAIPRYGFALLVARWSGAVGGGLALLLLQARCLVLCYPDRFAGADGPPAGGGRGSARPPAVRVAGMPIADEDLRTSVLVTGVTGSSKTAGILLPLLEQLFFAYDGRRREKLGAFIPEVKGDLVDTAIYLAHQAGRCVSRDVIVLSPACRIPVVRYRDERGRRWYLSARGGAGGSDAGDLFPLLVYPDSHPLAGRSAPVQALENPADCRSLLPAWSRIRIDLRGRQPRFVGWRWERGRLVAVSHTDGSNRQAARRDRQGLAISTDPPATLAAEAVEYVDGGVHYNLIDPRLPAAEVAERLTRVAAMTRGGGPRGENDYFYEQARKLLAACLSLRRAIGEGPPTIAEIVRLATQDGNLEAAVKALQARPDRHDEATADLLGYFRDEWLRLAADGKTATVVKSVLSAAFDPFLHDPQLAETFCRSSTFSFEDIAQEGRIVAWVPGDGYEQVGRLLGAFCKLDFQSAMLARTVRADLNSTRLAVYFADECHKYAVAGSAAAGDPYFMNLSRSNRVVNICATQSYAWLVEVLGREAANVYISAFGLQFWLQQTDPETCRRAAEICGMVTRERVSSEHELNFGGLLGALQSGRELPIRRRREEQEVSRFPPEVFALLDVGEVIIYNKGRPGRSGKVRRGRVSYLSCTEPPAGPAAVAARVREYYRERLENLAHERGDAAAWEADELDPAAELASYVGEPLPAP